MQFIIDVHLHSRFARATSRELNPSNLHKWSSLKGVDVVGTGDYTHPEWFAELSEQLEPAEEGLYQLEPASPRRRSNKSCPSTAAAPCASCFRWK